MSLKFNYCRKFVTNRPLCFLDPIAPCGRSRMTFKENRVFKGRAPPWWPCALSNKLLSAVRLRRGGGKRHGDSLNCKANIRRPKAEAM